jgi:hypothetical protein
LFLQSELCPAIDNPASCEIQAVIHFPHAKNISAAEIHHELCAIYGQNVMSEKTLRQWYTMFKDGQTNEQTFMMKSEVVMFKMLTKIFVKDGASQFENFYMNFLKFHALFSTRLSQLG